MKATKNLKGLRSKQTRKRWLARKIDGVIDVKSSLMAVGILEQKIRQRLGANRHFLSRYLVNPPKRVRKSLFSNVENRMFWWWSFVVVSERRMNGWTPPSLDWWWSRAARAETYRTDVWKTSSVVIHQRLTAILTMISTYSFIMSQWYLRFSLNFHSLCRSEICDSLNYLQMVPR